MGSSKDAPRDDLRDMEAAEISRSLEALCRHIEGRVLEEVAKPVRVTIANGRREVGLPGGWTVIRDDAARRFSLREAGSELGAPAGAAFQVGIPFRDPQAVADWVEPVWAPWVKALAGPGAESGDAWRRVRARLVNRVRRSGLLPAFRRSVREALGLYPDLARLCWRARGGSLEPRRSAGP